MAEQKMSVAKKGVIFGVVSVLGATVAGAAFALFSIINVPDAVTGFGTGTGAVSCQTTNVTFTWPDPTWDNTAGAYTVGSVGYSGITAACVTAGDATLNMQVSLAGSSVSVANGQAVAMSAASGTITLSSALDFADVPTSSINFLVTQ